MAQFMPDARAPVDALFADREILQAEVKHLHPALVADHDVERVEIPEDDPDRAGRGGRERQASGSLLYRVGDPRPMAA